MELPFLNLEAEMDARTPTEKYRGHRLGSKNPKIGRVQIFPADFAEAGNIKGDELSDTIGLKPTGPQAQWPGIERRTEKLVGCQYP